MTQTAKIERDEYMYHRFSVDVSWNDDDDDEQRRHTATLAIQKAVIALPEVVRDAVFDDLRGVYAAEEQAHRTSQADRVSYERSQQLAVRYIGRSHQSPLVQEIVDEGFGGEPEVEENHRRGSVVHRLLTLANDITALATTLADDSGETASGK